MPETDPLKKSVSDFDGKVDAVRKQIVATTEGGAITGEERLREHTDQLYGAILSYEGKPGDYQLAYYRGAEARTRRCHERICRPRRTKICRR